MTDKFNPERDGWGFTIESRKAHFFIGGESLCRKYGFRRAYNELGNDTSPDNCAACVKKVKKLQEAGELPTPTDAKETPA